MADTKHRPRVHLRVEQGRALFYAWRQQARARDDARLARLDPLEAAPPPAPAYVDLPTWAADLTAALNP